MNVLPLLTDLSPPVKAEPPARGSESSGGGFARMLDHALAQPDKAATPRPAAPAAHEPPSENRGSGPAADRTAPPPKGVQERSAASSGADRAARSTQKSPGEPASTEPGGTHPAKAGPATRKGDAKSPIPEGDRTAAAPKKPAKPEPDVVSPGATKSAQVGKRELPPFPTASAAGDSKKAVQTALEKAIELAAQKASPATKGGALPAAGEPAATAAKKSTAAGEVTPPQAGAEHGKAKRTKAAGTSVEVTAQLPTTPSLLSHGTDGGAQAAAAEAAGPLQSDRPANYQPPQGVQNTAAGGVPTFTVVDLRQASGGGGQSLSEHGSQHGNGDSAAIRLLQLAGGGTANEAPAAGQAAGMRGAAVPLPGQGFSAFTDHIVKQTGILLRDNNSGEIRLVLKPENLGQLRIKIDMVNNSLTGKIFVQNHEAMRLVQENLDTLARALRDSGFSAAQLNVSVGGREGNEQGKGRSSPLPQPRAIAGTSGFDSQPPSLEAMAGLHSLVDLVV